MSFEITSRLRNSLSKTNVRPSIVVEFPNLDRKFGTAEIQRIIRIGDDDLEIGGDWIIGGTVAVDNLQDFITFDGTSTTIKQNLEIDKGRSGTVSSLVVSMIDDGTMTSFVSPSVEYDDVLAEEAVIWAGLDEGTSYPEDYFVVFRGKVSSIDARQGKVDLTIKSPDEALRGSIFVKGTSKLATSISSSDTSLNIDEADADAFQPVVGIATGIHSYGSFDDEKLYSKYYVKINDEIIQYERTIDDTVMNPGEYSLLGLDRAKFGTSAAAHTAGDDIETIFEVGGHPLYIAMALMLSEKYDEDATYLDPGVYLTSYWGNLVPYAKQSITSVNFISFTETGSNTLFFNNIDLTKSIGVYVGNTIRIGDSTNNDAARLTVDSISVDDFGTRLVCTVDSGSLTTQEDEDGNAYFYAQNAEFSEGVGLKPSDVDVDKFNEIIDRNLNYGQYQVQIFLKDTVDNAKEFIDKELLLPFGCYSIYRNARISAGFNAPPFPGASTPILNEDNITNPSSLSIKRSTSKYFYNTVITKYNDTASSDDFTKAILVIDEDSRNQINVKSKPLIIESKGYKDGLSSAADRIRSISNRILARYKYAAQFINNIRLMPETGYNIEIGDIVLLDGANLNLPDFTSGSRDLPPRLYEVVNKTIDLRSLEVSIDVLDTNFDADARYALISPSSIIKSKPSSTQFIISAQYSKETYGEDEYKKWQKFFREDTPLPVKIRRADYSLEDETFIESISGNTITISDAVSFTIQAGDIMEFPDYSDSISIQTALYGYMADEPGFGDDSATYKMY